MICHRCGKNLKLIQTGTYTGPAVVHDKSGKTCCAVAYRAESWESKLDEKPGQLSILELYGAIEVK